MTRIGLGLNVHIAIYIHSKNFAARERVDTLETKMEPYL